MRLASQRICPTSVKGLITGRPNTIDPLVTENFILCVEEGALLVLDIDNTDLKQKVEGFTVQVQPVLRG